MSMKLAHAGTSLLTIAHESATACDFRRETLRTIKQLAPADTAEFVPFHPGAWPITGVDVDAAQLKLIERCEQNRNRYRDDIRLAVDLALRRGGFISTQVEAFHARDSLFFSEVIHARQISSQICLLPRWRGSPIGFVMLTRYGRSKAFSSRHLDDLLRLLPLIGLGAASQSIAGPVHDSAPVMLTSRELEIAQQVMRGFSTREIARFNGTSPFTVRNQLSRIFEKTGVLNRVDLAAWMARKA